FHVATGNVRVANAVASGARTAVNNPIRTLADTSMKLGAMAYKLPQEALHLVTNNPVWNLVSTGVSFIPGIGQVIGAGMGALHAIGAGASLHDIALRAARQSLPGQPVSGIAFDIAVGILLKGQRPDAAALKVARDNVPGGAAGKAAFDVATSLILGKSHSAV